MRLHWGAPNNPTKLRAWTGSIVPKRGVVYDNRFTDHELDRWYGVSFGNSCFVGIMIFAETEWKSEGGPLPYSSPTLDEGGAEG